MCSIADRNKESLFGIYFPVYLHCVVVWSEINEFKKGASYILHFPTALSRCEFLGHNCVESNSKGAEEWKSFSNATVDSIGVVSGDDLYCAIKIHRNAKGTGQTVTAAARDNPKSCVGIHKGGGNFVDCAVSTSYHDDIRAPFCCLERELSSVSFMLGLNYIKANPCGLQSGGGKVADSFFVSCPGNGIYEHKGGWHDSLFRFFMGYNFPFSLYGDAKLAKKTDKFASLVDFL